MTKDKILDLSKTKAFSGTIALGYNLQIRLNKGIGCQKKKEKLMVNPLQQSRCYFLQTLPTTSLDNIVFTLYVLCSVGLCETYQHGAWLSNLSLPLLV